MRKKKQEKNEEKEILQALSAKTEDEGEETAAAEQEKGETEDPAKKMEADVALFHSLFPEVKAESIPDEVWEMVEKGESLAASYALFTVKKQREEEKIRAVNEENQKKAPPRIRHDGAESEYFSPEAVKGMTRKEIKENYDAILNSMEKWN